MKLILEKPNFLVMDEPTNHLDIYSREILEEALEEYDGTLLVVSHDRYFLESVVNKIYEIDSDGAKLFNGNYEEYLSQKNEKKERNEEGIQSYEEQKKNRNRIASLERKYKRLEEKIEELENEKLDLEKEYEEAGRKNDLDRLIDIQKKLEIKDEEILTAMAEWEEIGGELEI